MEGAPYKSKSLSFVYLNSDTTKNPLPIETALKSKLNLHY